MEDPLVPEVNWPDDQEFFIFATGEENWTGYQNKQDQLNYANQLEEVNQKIQSATFVIENPLPTIELNVTKELPKPYHVIAGAFQFEENAQKRVDELTAKGYEASILGKNKWGLTQVAYASFYKKSDAFKTLANVRVDDSKDAWLLVKKFDWFDQRSLRSQTLDRFAMRRETLDS